MKQWRVWLTFSFLVALALTAMGLITRSTLVLESAQRAAMLNALQARLETNSQQQVATAVRTIDRYFVGLLATESLRSPVMYQFLPTAEELAASWRPPTGWQFNTFARAYFQVEPDSNVRLIGVREPDTKQVVELVSGFAWREDIPGLLAAETVGWAAHSDEMYRVNALVNGYRSELSDKFPVPQNRLPAIDPDDQPTASQEIATVPEPPYWQSPLQEPVGQDPPLSVVYVGPVYPVWLKEELFLVRKVTLGRQDMLQGCWLDWRRLRSQLLREIEPGLPANSQLLPVKYQPKGLSSKYASWAPLEIMTPEVEMTVQKMPMQGGWLTLLVGWVFMLVAGLAIGMLLQTVVRESRRRETFVSAVTHELRTPLTAFRLYTDLLAKNPDPEKTRVYAKILESEAERLSHLVENVLTYSRLERRGITSHHRMVSIGELLDSIVPRLDEHCLRNQMLLDYSDVEREVRNREILTDPSAVERILFNLVDNACKYGKSPAEALVQIQVSANKKMLCLEVRDFGPGMNPSQRRRMFQAYNHGQISTETPNRTIGLGLHICQQLAQALGGTLTFQDAQPGCLFRLELPLGTQ